MPVSSSEWSVAYVSVIHYERGVASVSVIESGGGVASVSVMQSEEAHCTTELHQVSFKLY